MTPFTVTVYTPTTVGADQATILVDGLKFINVVFYPAFALITAE
jgi:hypothetical protein